MNVITKILCKIPFLGVAPNKRIAKWCGANLFNHEYVAFLSAKDMKAKRFREKGEGR